MPCIRPTFFFPRSHLNQLPRLVPIIHRLSVTLIEMSNRPATWLLEKRPPVTKTNHWIRTRDIHFRLRVIVYRQRLLENLHLFCHSGLWRSGPHRSKRMRILTEIPVSPPKSKRFHHRISVHRIEPTCPTICRNLLPGYLDRRIPQTTTIFNGDRSDDGRTN